MTGADGIYVEWVGHEAVVLDRRSGELHYLNPTAATVLAVVQEHGYERGVAEVSERFGLPPDDPELLGLLQQMRASGIVSGPVPAAPPRPDLRPPGEPRAAPG